MYLPQTAAQWTAALHSRAAQRTDGTADKRSSFLSKIDRFQQMTGAPDVPVAPGARGDSTCARIAACGAKAEVRGVEPSAGRAEQPATKRESLSTRTLAAKLASFEAAANEATSAPPTKKSWKQDRPGSWKAKLVVVGGVAGKKRLSQLP